MAQRRLDQREILMRTRRMALIVLFAVFGTLLAPASIPRAAADGTPNLLLSKTVPQRALLGVPFVVDLSLANTAGPNGYNVSFTETLPAGVSYVGGSTSPEPLELVQGDGTTVLVWNNLADIVTGTTVNLTFSIVAGAGFGPGSSVITTSGAYANTNARTAPDIDPTTGVAVGDFSGFDTASRSTTMSAFELTKAEPSMESELLRGVHDHQTPITLTITNNAVAASTDLSIIDYLPAGVEFLGCGGVDNTSGGDEYPGSGAINPGNEASMSSPCIAPTSIATVNLDPDGLGQQPSGVYTRLTWSAATLATTISAGGTFAMDYLAAIPLRENVQTSVGDLTANLGNNTGALTTETETELESYTIASGTYSGDGSSATSASYHEVTPEDISIHKAVDQPTFVQGDTPTFTLLVESSEYATSSGPVTVTDTLPASLDFTGASPAVDSAVVLGDGSTLLTWTLPSFTSANTTVPITVNTLVRTNWRNGDGSDGTPVASNDSHTNSADLAADMTVVSDNDGTTSTVTLGDDSSASQTSAGPTVLKQTSTPVAGTLTCGDGTGVTFTPTTASAYRPGDRVCFRLDVDFPAALDTLAPVVTDLLPDGFAFESWTTAAASDVDSSAITFTDDAPLLVFELDDQDVGGVHVELIISTVVDTPDAAADGDIIGNLMKVRHLNSAAEMFQLRDDALVEWTEAQLTLDKAVTLLNGVGVAGAPADGVTVEEGDLVTYQLDLANTGSVDALDAAVRDILPVELSCSDVSSISNGGECDVVNGWIEWETADDIDIVGGASVQLTYVVTVPVGISAGASLTNSAGVRTYDGETNTGTPFTYVPADNIDSAATPNTTAAGDTSEIVTTLPEVTKTVTTSITEPGNRGNDQATIGEIITYTVDVDLPDAISYYEAVITDVLDPDKDLIESSVTATLDGNPLPVGFVVTADDPSNSITVDFPSVYAIADGPDEQLSLVFDAMVIDAAANVRSHDSANSAVFTFENAAATARSVTASADVEIVEPNITLGKSNDDADGKIVAGQIVTYTIDVENSDNGDVSRAHETTVVDTVPDELIVLEAANDPAEDGDTIAPDGGTWDASSRTITWGLGSLDPSDTASLSYQIQIGNPLVAAGTLRNTAVVTTSSMAGSPAIERTSASPNGSADGQGYVDSASSSVVVPVIDLVKSVSSLAATIGDPLTYTLTIDLPAAVIAYDVTAFDDLPPGLQFESVSSVTCDEGGSTCVPDITSVDVVEGGGDVAFFLGDLASEAAGDRTVTIDYIAYVDDVMEADSGSNLRNTATVYWNDTDTIAGTPATPPPAGAFSDASGPWSVVVTTREPTLTVDKDVVGQLFDSDERRAKPGDTLSYSITVSNIGPTPAYSATISDLAAGDGWLFTDTTTASGVTNTDGNPAGGVEWLIDGPISAGSPVTITYDLTIPLTLTSGDEVAGGSDTYNTADVPSYFGVSAPNRAAFPARSYREYDDVTADRVDLELDLASIGDRVWFDANGDGVQDPSEPGIPDVDVLVTYLGDDGTPGGGDDESFTVSTDATGAYLADRLPGGSYTVVVDEADPDFLVGVVSSYDQDGGTGSPDGAWAGPLAQDGDALDLDFGYTGTGSIGDTVWFDQNRDGTIDVTEGRIDNVGVDVVWLGPDGIAGGGDDVSYRDTTDASGTYQVNNLPPGAFVVTVDVSTLPTGYQNVADPGGESDDQATLTLGGGAVDLDQDFGYAGSDIIGDLIWLDQDDNGAQNGAEPGLGGIIVELTYFGPDSLEGTPDDSSFSTTTDATGAYEFSGLPPGLFEVEVTGGVPTSAVNSSDPDTPSPGDSRSEVTLTGGAANLDQDFGFSASSVLGDRVWWDLDRDGTQDLGEPGINDVEVTATFLGPDGTLGTVDDQTFVTVTAGDGDYLFTDVSDGAYSLAVTGGVPAGFDPVADEDSGTVAPDETVGLNLATVHLTADFGYSGSGTIGDAVWFDADRNGFNDGTDFGIGAVGVELTWLGADGVAGGGDDIMLAATSDSSGAYAFAELPAGAFEVDIDTATLLGDLTATYDSDSGTTSPDGSSAVTLSIGQSNIGVDFGFSGSATIGDSIWFDLDGDGAFDTDEPPLSGVSVDVVWTTPASNRTFVAATDSSGAYLLDNLPTGQYTVIVDGSTLPGGLSATFDADGGFDASSDTTLTIGAVQLDQDFGFRGNASIGNIVWLDIDGDGARTLAEPGISGQVVDLTWQSPAGPVVWSTVTGADGSYLFTSLADGTYTATVVGGIVPLADNVADPGADGDSTNDLVIAGGADSLDQNFGYQGLNRIGDQVWADVNRDGVFGPEEIGLEGVGVEATWLGPDDLSGTSDDVRLPLIRTDAAGLYAQTGLPDGSFDLEVIDGLPTGIDTPSHDADSIADGMSRVSNLGVSSTTAVDRSDQDFGYSGQARIGDTIWLNLDGNTNRDPNEPGLADVEISLYAAGPDGVLETSDDLEVARETTESDGSYLFDHLSPGAYRVTYDEGDLDAGLRALTDADGPDHSVTVLQLEPDGARLDIDFGVRGSSTLDGTVFIDSDGDGIQDSGEVPLPDVAVTVRWEGPAGPIDFSLVTDVDGFWELVNMPAGDYIVILGLSTVPENLVPSMPVVNEVSVGPGGSVVASNGLVPASSIGDLVWHDDNRDAAVTQGEVGVESVRLSVRNADGDTLQSVTTEIDGSYVFEPLPPGIYTIEVDMATAPAGMEIVSSPHDPVLDDTAENGHTVDIELAPSTALDTIDFGLDDPRSVTAPALAFSGRTIGDLLLLSGILMWVGLTLTEWAKPRRRRVQHLEISADGRRIVM